MAETKTGSVGKSHQGFLRQIATGFISEVRDNRTVDKLVRSIIVETTTSSIGLSSKIQQERGHWSRFLHVICNLTHRVVTGELSKFDENSTNFYRK
jgi:hypothetical protein